MMIVESVQLSDLKSLSELYEELNGITTDINKMRDNLEWILLNPDYYLMCVKNEINQLIGSALGIVCHDIVGECRPFMVLENMIVSKKYRKLGVGKKLVQQVEQIARNRNCYYIMLVSLLKRKEAHKFYQSLGYSLDVVQGFKKYL